MENEIIYDVIRNIREFHSMISNDFVLKSQIPNLSSKYIRDFVNTESNTVDAEFMSLIISYQELVTRALITSDFEFNYSDLDFRSRVKQRDSIVNKMLYYVLNTNQQGKVSVNKCLNDLLGFRIQLNCFDHNNNGVDLMCGQLHLDSNYKILCKNSCKDSYNGTHVYIYGSNFTFPWELQIWDSNDSNENERSHSEHKAKRAYISWPQIHAESMPSNNIKGG
ncbi:hypothetical protein [Paenibacillus sinopodophylli]|uniref:hypothetical protein n=1 Tax=Paenibacillus sinopodophylli TaxID=1837342 RepID=UPI00110CEC65|nr:hypothetical protein [Paenibacillus sinopodophylli]